MTTVDGLAACRAVVDRHSADLIALSHSLHAEPELSFAEYRSAEKVSAPLEAAGFAVQRGVAGLDTAFVATAGAGDLVIALCAEYDALPEIGHACGHNIIAAAAVGAALALRELASELGITVRVLGTPAEESGGGKIIMLEHGLFDDVSMALLAHPAPDENCAPASLAITQLRADFSGRAAHAALAPQLGANAADAVTLSQVAIGLARQQLEPRQLVNGIITHAGESPNTIPAAASALYDLRAPDLESLARLQERVTACLAGAATATGCQHRVTPTGPAYAELVLDPWLTDAYRTAVRQLGRRPVPVAQEPLCPTGSTDLGNVSRRVPVIHPTVALDCGDAVNHQPEFAEAARSPSADRAVRDAATALAATAAAAAADPAQRRRLRAPSPPQSR